MVWNSGSSWWTICEVKLQDHSSWVCGCQAHTWVMNLFFFTRKLLLMFLKILAPSFCVSMVTCSLGIEVVCS